MPVPKLPVPKLLIDGYNLLFQTSLAGRGRGPAWLARARQRLQAWLCSKLSPEELRVTQVVYDASGPRADGDVETTLEGMTIRYATQHAEADDLLEQIIRQHPTPKQLTVVSSDVRLRRCAAARKAVSLSSEEFIEQLQRRGPQLSQPHLETANAEEATRLGELPEAEVAYWLKQFKQ